MKKIENYFKDIKDYNTTADQQMFLDFCRKYDLVKGEDAGYSGGGEIHDLLYLIDHLMLFKTSSNMKYFVSSTYYSGQELSEVIKKYNLQNHVLVHGESFWHPRSTLLIFDYDFLKLTLNLYQNDLFRISLNTPEAKKYFSKNLISKVDRYNYLKETHIRI